MRSTEPKEGSNGGSDQRVWHMARYLVGDLSSRMHPSGVRTLVHQAWINVFQRVKPASFSVYGIVIGSDLAFVAVRKC